MDASELQQQFAKIFSALKKIKHSHDPKSKKKEIPTSKNKKDDEDNLEAETLQSFVGKLMDEFILPIEKQISEHDDSKSEYQRIKLYIQLKTKSILAPLEHPQVAEFAKKLDSERKAALEVAINNLFGCEPQKETETIETFAARVQYSANECLSLITLGEDDDKQSQADHIRKMQYFIFVSGLEEEVKKWVVRKMPDDFVKAVIVAMLISLKLVEVKARVQELEH